MKQFSWETAIIVGSLVLTLLLGIRNPLFEPPDELLHYRYVRHLIVERTLPVQEIDGAQSHSHHPPLYYAIAAVLAAPIDDAQVESESNPYWTSYQRDSFHFDNKNLYLPNEAHQFPWQGTALVMHLLRAYSTLLFGLTLLLVRRIAQLVWPARAELRRLLIAFVAFNPMLIYISSAFNNDNLLILFGTLTVYLSLTALKSNSPYVVSLMLGIVWGLALLTKLNGLVLAAVFGGVLLWWFFYERQYRKALLSGTIIALVGFVMSVWWFVRNIRVYGDLFGMRVHLAVWGARTESQFNLGHFQGDLLYTWSNFWGRFGYGQINMPGFLYQLLAVITVVALFGGLYLLIQRRGAIRPIWVIFSLASFTFIAAMIYYLVNVPVGANARYVFPVSVCIAALLSSGYAAFPRSWRLPDAVTIGMFCLAVMASGWLIPRTYAAPEILSDVADFPDNAVADDICWDEMICLVQHAVESVEESGQQMILFTGCWQHVGDVQSTRSRNISYFVHLLDVDFNPLGSRDTHFGLGNFPTSLWQSGTAFCETVRVPVTAQPAMPLAAQVEVGLVDAASDDRLIATGADGLPIELLFVDQVRIEAVDVEVVDVGEEFSAEFQNAVQLSTYAWREDPHDDGRLLTLTTTWQVLAPLSIDYTIFAHMVNGDNNIVIQADGPPLASRLPTSLWRAEDTLTDERSFLLPDNESELRLTLGFYDPISGQRLLRSDEPGDSVVLQLP